MRRILAIVVLIAFGSPLILPALASSADPQRALPACCRLHGAHHCTGLMASTPNTPAFKAPPCANYPAPAIQLRLTQLAYSTPAAAAATLLRTSSLLPTNRSHTYEIPSTSNPTRGPPSLA